eukprot:m.114550 g.114550  ORF g.114550 m.114550 type:complete len:59 (-) comp13056_c0_seq2:2448-2624(-)
MRLTCPRSSMAIGIDFSVLVNGRNAQHAQLNQQLILISDLGKRLYRNLSDARRFDVRF